MWWPAAQRDRMRRAECALRSIPVGFHWIVHLAEVINMMGEVKANVCVCWLLLGALSA